MLPVEPVHRTIKRFVARVASVWVCVNRFLNRPFRAHRYQNDLAGFSIYSQFTWIIARIAVRLWCAKLTSHCDTWPEKQPEIKWRRKSTVTKKIVQIAPKSMLDFPCSWRRWSCFLFFSFSYSHISFVLKVCYDFLFAFASFLWLGSHV